MTVLAGVAVVLVGLPQIVDGVVAEGAGLVEDAGEQGRSQAGSGNAAPSAAAGGGVNGGRSSGVGRPVRRAALGAELVSQDELILRKGLLRGDAATATLPADFLPGPEAARVAADLGAADGYDVRRDAGI